MREVLSVARALGDGSRLRAVVALSAGELCVCQIIHVLGLSPATVSKHMEVLERAGLVTKRREGRWRYYRLAGGGAGPASSALAWVLDAMRGDPSVKEDARKTRTVRKRNLEELSACYRS